MTITFRDSIGYVSVTLEPGTVIDFFDGKAYFTDGNDRDYTIMAADVVSIAAD